VLGIYKLTSTCPRHPEVIGQHFCYAKATPAACPRFSRCDMGIIKRRFAIAIVETAISAPREFHPTEVLSYCPHLLRRDSGILPLHARLHGWTGVSPHCRLSPYRWQTDIRSRAVSLVVGLGSTGWLFVVCPVPMSRKILARPLLWLIAFAIAMGKYLMIDYEVFNVRLVLKAGSKQKEKFPLLITTLRCQK